MRELFADRNFRWLFAGQVASAAGDSVLLIVLGIWVKNLTGSSGMAGAVMLGMVLPGMVAPLFGWAVDRVRRRPFLLWTNVGSAVALVPLFAVHQRSQIWIIYLVSLGYGVSFSLNWAGMTGLLKAMVTDARLAEANGVLRTFREGLRLVGPLAGAGLYAAAGAGTVVLIDLVSFLVAAVGFAAIRLAEPEPARTGLHWAESGAGFRHLFGEPVLRRISLALGASLLVLGTIESCVYAYVDIGLHRPPTFVGPLMTAMGVGSIAGALLAPRLLRRSGDLLSVAAGLAAMGCGVGLLLVPSLAVGLTAGPLVGLGLSIASVAFATSVQRRTPGRLTGRVSTATDLMTATPQAASIAAGAVLVSVVDYRWLLGVAALGMLLVAAVLRATRPATLTVPPPVVAPAYTTDAP